MPKTRKAPSNTYAAQLRRFAQTPSACAVATIARTDEAGKPRFAIVARDGRNTLADKRASAARAAKRAVAMLATLGALAGCGGGDCHNPHPGTVAECGTVACTLCDD